MPRTKVTLTMEVASEQDATQCAEMMEQLRPFLRQLNAQQILNIHVDVTDAAAPRTPDNRGLSRVITAASNLRNAIDVAKWTIDPGREEYNLRAAIRRLDHAFEDLI